MAYPKFVGVIPKGKEIDLAITKRQWGKAVELLRAAERDLTIRRKIRGQRLISLPKGSRQRVIDQTQMDLLNKKIDSICETLRGKMPSGKEAMLIKLRKPKKSTPVRRRRR